MHEIFAICFDFTRFFPAGKKDIREREIIALDRQGTQQQKPEPPTVTSPGMRVNTRYINSTKGTSSKKDAPIDILTLHVCVYVYVCVYMLNQFRDLRTMSRLE